MHGYIYALLCRVVYSHLVHMGMWGGVRPGVHLFSHAPAEEQHLWVVSVLRGEISKRLVSVMARLPCALGFVDSEDSDMTLMSLCITRRKRVATRLCPSEAQWGSRHTRPWRGFRRHGLP